MESFAYNFELSNVETMDQATDVALTTIKALIVPVFTMVIVADTIAGVVGTPILAPFIATTIIACMVFALNDLEKVLDSKLNKATNLLLPSMNMLCLGILATIFVHVNG